MQIAIHFVAGQNLQLQLQALCLLLGGGFGAVELETCAMVGPLRQQTEDHRTGLYQLTTVHLFV